MFNKIRNIIFTISFAFVSSCGVTEYITNSEDSAPELNADLDLELKSAEDENFLENQNINDETNSENSVINDSITVDDSDQKLESSPVKEYDSIMLSDTDLKKDLDVVEEKPNVTLPQIQKLELRDKIQYRIATINFRSGSSFINYNGLKKIKKIVKLAKERNAKIKIVGHASKRTKDMPLNKHKLVNFSISHKRAQTVAKIVTEKYNFPSENLITEAVSDSKPLFREDMPAGTTANQRTEIFIIY